VAWRQLPLRPFVLSLVAALGLLLLAPSAASAAWTVPPTPNVPGANDTSLNAVDCTAANSCMAVGNALFPAGFKLPTPSATVAERWDGTSWQIVPTPNPPGATFSTLNGVSCPRQNVCFAVGSWRTDPQVPIGLGPPGIPRPFVELWNGTGWSIQPSPDVAWSSLDAVSCSGLLACTAVGNVYDPSSGDTRPLAERWDGSWRVQSTPDPTGSQDDELVAVSCPVRRTCTAVGNAITFLTSGGTSSSPLVERWFGRVNSWGQQSAPKPAGAGFTGLAGVSCPDVRVCFAVGKFGVPSPNVGSATLAERRLGSSWAIMPTPNPGPYQSSLGPAFDAELNAVSCPGRQACRAIGFGQGLPGDFGTSDFGAIDDRFDGASWQQALIRAPGIPTVALSCPSRLFCMAVGHGSINGAQGVTASAKWTP
jgi:hypothetical protein